VTLHIQTRDADGAVMRVSARRYSVWLYLVALALTPALGVAAVAGALTIDRIDQATTAGRLADEVMAIGAMDRARTEFATEFLITALTVEVDLGGTQESTQPAVLALLGLAPTLTVAAARRQTDTTLAAVPRTKLARPELRELGKRLSSWRGTVDQSLREGTRTAVTSQLSVAIQSMVASSESRLAYAVADGQDGMPSSRLVAASHDLESIAEAVVSGSTEANVALRFSFPMAGQRVTQLDLRRAADAYSALTARLDNLSNGLRTRWRLLQQAAEVTAFHAAIASQINAATPSSARSTVADPGLTKEATQTVTATFGYLDVLSGFLREGVAAAVKVARSDHQSARDRAVATVAISGLLLVVTAVILLTIGGQLRRRLAEVAAGARRFSAGQLEPIPVHGPRELAAAGEAINAAVASLRQVESKAAILASGDLNSPELETPAPGPLGAVVDASVARVVAAVRGGEELRRELARLAAHDRLTGLPNRAELERRLTIAVDNAQRTGAALTLLFIDLDKFKQCNDRLGHAAGDHVLRVVSQRMGTLVGPPNTVARLGGDEFVVLVETADTDAPVLRLAEQIVAALATPIDFNGQQVQIGGSVGLASLNGPASDSERLLREADAAVYRAKALGGSVVVIYDEATADTDDRSLASR
jgi:diguanylate cyclase (GGDEF)-like protein